MDSVVFIHGLWMLGTDMALLRRRVKRCGFKVSQFSYSSVRKSPRESAVQLQTFLQTIEAERLHFVAHSLGGLVVRHLFDLYPEQRRGNILTLGTPHHGSQVAQQFQHSFIGRLTLGKSIEQGLLGGAPQWHAPNPLGVIAGVGKLGIGRLIASLSKENDGTIAVSETHLVGEADHITMACSHMGLVYKQSVAKQVCTFLKQGHFMHTSKPLSDSFVSD